MIVLIVLMTEHNNIPNIL